MKTLSKTMIIAAVLFVLPFRVMAYENKPYGVNATDPVYIHNEAEWWDLWWGKHSGVDVYSKEIYLCGDIEFGIHTPVRTTGEKTFTGKLHGQGHTLSNLIYDTDKYDSDEYGGDMDPEGPWGRAYNVGLFGRIENALIEDLTLVVSGDGISGDKFTGVVCGIATYSTIQNVTVSGSCITCDDEACGGIVGQSFQCNYILNCTNKLQSIYVDDGYAGGIVGYSRNENGWTPQIIGCVNYCTVEGNDDCVGGIIGFCSCTTIIDMCINRGTIKNNSGDAKLGGIVGDLENNSTISRCTNEGQIFGHERSTGGIAGYAAGGSIQSCINKMTVKGGDTVGGICGASNICVLKHCLNIGNVSGEEETGGIIGRSVGTITSCFNTGDVDGEDAVGGIAGYVLGYSIIGCVNMGTVSGDDDYADICGDVDIVDSGSVNDGCWTGDQIYYYHSELGLEGNPMADGYVCWILDTKDNSLPEEDRGQWVQSLGADNMPMPAALSSHPEARVYGGYEHLATAFALSNHPLHPAAHNAETNNHDACCVDGLCSVCGRMSGTLVDGVVKDGDVYLLSTADHLRWFANMVKNADNTASAKLTADIDLGGAAWIPIGLYDDAQKNAFLGTFDGQGHTISNLSFDHTTGDYSAYDDYGLFGRLGEGGESNVHKGTVRNLVVMNASLAANSRCGVIAGEVNGGVIENVATLGTITFANGENQKGGLAGEFSFGHITSSYTEYSAGWCLNADPSVRGTATRSYYGTDVTDNLATGKLCYDLNGTQTAPAWGQNVASDERPVLTGEGVYYSRTVSAVGDIGTICLPFDGVLQGAQLYEISSLTTSGGNISEIEFTAAHDPEAGKGYVFQATDTELVLRCTGEPVSAKANNGIVGVIAAGKTTVPGGGYIIKGSELKRSGGAATVGTCKAYIFPSAYIAPSATPNPNPQAAPSSLPAMILTVEK